jgi:hypothetical protein
LVGAGVRAMSVVEVSPRRQPRSAIRGVLMEAGACPFADGGLDEAVGLAVGARSVDAGANVFDLELAAGLGERVGVRAATVVDMTRRTVMPSRAK